MKKALTILTLFCAVCFAQEKGTFTDSRDGKKYKTVKIGTQTWMAENLNYETKKSGCYKNKKSYCEQYGRWYEWEIAQKACPEGWHLPSDKEWKVLTDFAGEKKLKAKDEWKNCKGTYEGYENGKSVNIEYDDCGTDDYGFGAMPGGVIIDTNFARNYDFDLHGWWWESNSSGRRYSAHNIHGFDLGGGDWWEPELNSYAINIRCIQDGLGSNVSDKPNVKSTLSGKYPQASQRILNDSDLRNLSKSELKIMRNEIFARHGYIFKTDDMKTYFESQNWYVPKYDNVNSMLSDIETTNIAFITRYE